MSTYHIWTIGCQMNKAESERLAALFAEKGMAPTANAADADLIIVNTCVVRQHAEARVVNRLHTLKALKQARPSLTLAVTGCWVDSNPDALRRRFPHIDYFFRAGESPPWLVADEWRHALPHSGPITAYVPIIQGCNNFCAYCIVPYRRGREKSRSPSEVISEVQELVRRGTREVTLLGQNVDSYGHDLPSLLPVAPAEVSPNVPPPFAKGELKGVFHPAVHLDSPSANGKDTARVGCWRPAAKTEHGTPPHWPDLAYLLTALSQIDGLWRIRFLTNHPKDMSQRLIEAVASLDKVCPSLNIPVQAGSDAVLKLMRRGYTVQDYRRLIGRIREAVPGVALSNDVIVGFPTETEAQFQETLDLLSDLRFDVVHAAAYSPRPGTTAARDLPDDVPAAEKKRRLQLVEQLQERMAGEINAALVGQEVEVLVEGRQKGKWYGRTRTDKLVFFTHDGNWLAKLAMIEVRHSGPWSLQGIVSRRNTCARQDY